MIFVPRKLNDTQIAELLFKHTNGTSITALAKEYGIDWTTCKRYIEDSKDLQEKYKTIKNESITEWLKSHTGQIQGLLDLCIDLLPEKLKSSNARDIIGAYKILTETSVNNVENKPTQNNNALDNLVNAINNIAQLGEDNEK
jgi:hypothetical protein